MKDRLDAILRRPQAEYLETLLQPRDALLGEMERYAGESGQPIADPEVAQLLRILTRVRRPRRVLEVGTNIGYSVIVIGRESGADSTIETIELDATILATARRFVAEAALPCEVVFHQGAALEVIPHLAGTFDMLFIDCVKTEYVDYLDSMLPKLAPGAIVIADNVLWKGQVAEGPRSEDQIASTAGLKAYNARVTSDRRLETVILPLGDGIALSIVRE